MKNSRAGAAIVDKAIEGFSQPQLLVKNVNAALIEALKIFAPKLRPAVPGVDPTAKVAAGVKMGKNVSIGSFAVIEDGVEIGDDTIIAAGCKIGQNTKIGRATPARLQRRCLSQLHQSAIMLSFRPTPQSAPPALAILSLTALIGSSRTTALLLSRTLSR